MKTAFATSALAMAGYTDAFVASPAARSSLLHGNSRSSKAAIRATPSMEFAGGLIGADGPEPTSKNFDPLGLSKAQPENILFFRESEIKVSLVGDMFAQQRIYVHVAVCTLYITSAAILEARRSSAPSPS